ncbi:MAG TPA: hypothetical protein VE643_09635, partial [Nitrososphaeraceae archaeon]|nr:hypothetical protein [Nitrososphaeraceae archaeon]
ADSSSGSNTASSPPTPQSNLIMHLAAVQVAVVAAPIHLLRLHRAPVTQRHLKQVYPSQQQLLLQIKSSTVREAQ